MLKNTNPTLSLTWYVNGTATDVGSVTVTLTDLNGTAAISGAATGSGGTGVYTYTLPDAVTGSVGFYTAEWLDPDTNDTRETTIEIIGRHIVSEAAIRSFDPSLSNTTKYPDLKIVEARDWVTDRLEQWCHRSFIPRYRLAKWDTGGTMLWVDEAQQTRGGSSGLGSRFDIQSVVAASSNGSDVTASTTVVDGGFARTAGTFATATRANPLPVTVEWEYGYNTLVDGVERVCLLLIRNYLVQGPVSITAISAANDYGTSRFVAEGGPMRNPSSIAEVNDWVSRHSMRTPVI